MPFSAAKADGSILLLKTEKLFTAYAVD